MIAAAVLGAAVFVLLSLVAFFVFAVLFPALREFSLSAENALFSDMERLPDVSDGAERTAGASRAVVLCPPEKNFSATRLRPDSAQSCALIDGVYGSLDDCHSSCIGLGDCARVCPQDAITIENGCAVVTDLCAGCGICVAVCPKRIIVLMPRGAEDCVLCGKTDASATTCDACGKTQKIPMRVKRGFKLWRKWCKMREGFYTVSIDENAD